ncbi:arginine--tRNA ligase [bacterium]|nr:arginine--tRNA ligase [bacterium]
MKRAHRHLAEQIRKALTDLGIAEPRIILEKPRDPEHGDIATNAAMVYCKQLKLAPRKLAEQLTKRLALNPELVQLAGVAGPGFINFRFADAYLQTLVKQILESDEHFGEGKDLAGKKVLIEFVSANPSGPLNVVSARAAAVGDCLVRMFRTLGATCHSEFYVNDAGNQVKLLGDSVRARFETLLGNEIEIPEGGYHGEYIVEFAEQLVDEEGDKYSKLSAEDASNTLGLMAVERHVGMQRNSLERFRVHMDGWFRESQLRESRAEYAALEELKQKGTLYEKDGATFLRTSEFGDTQDWVVITSEGRPTYFLPDIAYHLSKFKRGYDIIIDILGPDHHSYLTKMAAAMRALGRDTEHLEIILLQHITLSRSGEPVKMSKRAGQMIEMNELLDEVGCDAARYFFLLRRTTTQLDFDIELAKKQSDDNPVFYVQYAHARIQSIFRKAEIELKPEKADFSLLNHPEELILLRRLREFEEVISDCVVNRDPHAMTVWLREVAAQFHRFYHHCRVITEPEELSLARLALCRATQTGLKRGLSLCGVNAPEEM